MQPNIATDVDRSIEDGIGIVTGYKSPMPSRALRFLWWCAGADSLLLRHSPVSEQRVYGCLGLIVLLTGVLALLTSSYALFFVFNGFGQEARWTSIAAGLGFGLLWGTMIFNLDRFIIAVGGKGDGTERITGSEIWQATPRILLAAIIGITLSTPLELKIFEREIQSGMEELRRNRRAALLEKDEPKFTGEISRLDSLIRTEVARRASLDSTVATRVSDMQREYYSGGRSGRPGEGPVYRSLEEDKRRLEQERSSVEAAIGRLRGTRDSIAKAREEHRVAVETTTSSAGGVADAIQFVHSKHPGISFLIAMLFLVIETMPVFAKLMMKRGVYDAYADLLRHYLPARTGVVGETRDHFESLLVRRTTDDFPLADLARQRSVDRLQAELRSTNGAKPDVA